MLIVRIMEGAEGDIETLNKQQLEQVLPRVQQESSFSETCAGPKQLATTRERSEEVPFRGSVVSRRSCWS